MAITTTEAKMIIVFIMTYILSVFIFYLYLYGTKGMLTKLRLPQKQRRQHNISNLILEDREQWTTLTP